MRQTKTFRLSAETIEYLKQKDNASTYIEHLIELDKQTPDGANYIKKPESEGSAELDDRYSNKEILMQIHKVKAKLLDIEKSGVRGTTLNTGPTLTPMADTPIQRPVYHGKVFLGNEDIKHRDCLCPYEVNERGLNERSGTADECPIHGDSVGFEDLL